MEYDNNLTGALFNESKSEVIKRGNFMINGVKRYGVLIKSENDKGQEKFELMISAGLVYHHDEAEKKSPKSPDVSGRVYFDEMTYKFGAWNKIGHDSGNEFLSCSFMPVLDEETKAPF
jgi:hypothetical protein